MRKLLYVVLVLITALFAVSSSGPFPRFLLAFELLFAAALFVQVRCLARRLEVSLTLTQKSILQGNQVGAQLHIKNPTHFPAGTMEAELCMRDLSGWYPKEDYPEKKFTVHAGADRRRTDLWQTDIQPVHCGLIQIQIEEIRVYDYIGLFSARLRGPFMERYVSVLPNVYPLKTAVELQQSAGREGWQEDVAAKPGSDTQEIFDTRFYQRGDTLHNIHWKLSAKADDLLVKEFSMPLDTAFYLVADCAYAADKDAKERSNYVTSDQMDHFLEMTAAIAGHFAAQNEPCELIWYMAEQEKVESCRIEREEDLYQALEGLLGICPYPDGTQPDWNEAGITDDENEMLRITLDGSVVQSGQQVVLELDKDDSNQ